ncbi:MAG: glycoside hydrolase family 127 protein [Acidobacteriota bacterium]|nr:glycoside hydrolase family 127 protein [Acidobacteriota bacterium]
MTRLFRKNTVRGFLLITAVTAALVVVPACGPKAASDYPHKPVSFTDVHFEDDFWAPRLETNRTVTIPHNFRQSEETGRIRNFELAAEALQGETGGEFCTRFPFDDSDVFKVIEAAAYALSLERDPELEAYIDGLAEKIAAAQEPDGYLYSARTIGGPPPVDWMGDERWANLYMSHELYNPGHFYEAAAAYYEATGKRNLLDIALKNAELILAEFGPGKRQDPPGHQEIEIGLVKLYRITGDARYLDLAKFFLDVRGRTDSGRKLYGEYSQDHKPVTEQDTAVGHAVRANYMYTAMADIAALTGDQAYIAALDRIWDDVIGTKIYLTGGIGAAGSWEGYGPAYRLPNVSAYAETCAAIATFLWNHRMFLLKADGKYADVMERILYNGLLSGISLSGDKFFYPNPLASFGQHERTPWFPCACCPPNVARILASVPEYAYVVSKDGLFVNLYVQGSARATVGKTGVTLNQTTDYPWTGDVTVDVRPEKPAAFTLHVRIPGWAVEQPIPSDLYTYLDRTEKRPVVKVNGEEAALDIRNGYVSLRRTWRDGDRVEISLPMAPRRVLSHEAVEVNRGRVAVERGPLVYCAEWPDNDGRVHQFVLPDASDLRVEHRPGLLNGITVITAEAEALSEKSGRLETASEILTLIPYYAWANRGKGEMAVWLARDPARARPVREPGPASMAEVKASEGAVRPQNVNDQYEPESSGDAAGYMHWWPKKGTLEWIEYSFKAPVRVSESSVYWFDDTGAGQCRVPASWRLLYRSGGRWLPVETGDEYGVVLNAYNTVSFAPVRTTGLRLEVQLQEEWSAGIQEWTIK